jgi:heptosyltransferase-2
VSAIKPRILVIRGGAIGDFILTLPAIAALRRQFPQAHLEVLGYPHIAQLAVAGGLADRVQPIEARGLAGFFARGGALEPDLMDYFSEFDLVISYLYDPDEIFKTNVCRCAVGQFIVGPHRPDETERIHATRVYLKPLERLAIFDAENVPRLNVGQASSRSQTSSTILLNQVGDRRDAGPALALHPGSGGEKKNWPETKWKELLRDLINRMPVDLLLIGGEVEADRLQNLVKVLPADRVQLAQNLPLCELALRLNDCFGFIGHDSGITHLAAAVGLPTLVLWAETNEEIWRPLGEHVVILREQGGLASLAVGTVMEQIASLQVDNRFEQDRSRLFRRRPPPTS